MGTDVTVPCWLDWGRQRRLGKGEWLVWVFFPLLFLFIGDAAQLIEEDNRSKGNKL